MIEHILGDNNQVLAIIIRHDYDREGIDFITPDDYSMQLAYMHHQKGHVIQPHIHNKVLRQIEHTKEVLVIQSGSLKCDFFTDTKEYLKSTVLCSGDIILLISGGHGFTCLEETKMVEIKQGPYAGENDKVRFIPNSNLEEELK